MRQSWKLLSRCAVEMCSILVQADTDTSSRDPREGSGKLQGLLGKALLETRWLSLAWEHQWESIKDRNSRNTGSPMRSLP